MKGIRIIEDVHLFPEIKAVLVTDSGTELREDYDFEPLAFGKMKVAPWGMDNLLPNHILRNIEKNDVVPPISSSTVMCAMAWGRSW